MIKSDMTLLELIHALKEMDGGGITELAEYTGKSKSTVHRHLATLLEHQYVVKDGRDYYLGLRFLDIGGYVRTRITEHKRILSKIRNLAEETEEAVQFVAEEHGQGVFIYRVTGDKAVNTEARIGSRFFLHRAAAGKAILASLPQNRANEIVEQWGLPAKTSETISDRKTLDRELRNIRKTGVAFDRGEHISGLHAIGTTVKGTDEEIIGGISISGPAYRMDGEFFTEELPRQLLGTANELELNIAYS